MVHSPQSMFYTDCDIGYQRFDQVWNIVGKIISPQFFWKYAPDFFCRFWVTNQGSSLCQAFLADTVETGTKNRCMNHSNAMPCFARKAWAFLKRVGPRILSLKGVDYFGASEHYWVVEEKKILISKIAVVRCCKLSMYANESCDERSHAISFWRWLKWHAM